MRAFCKASAHFHESHTLCISSGGFLRHQHPGVKGDGLPIALPTEKAVAEFLSFTDLPPNTSLGAIPPAQRAVTVRHVAVNGVMAGCPPEFMPLLLAFTEAMKDGDFRRTLASTHAWTPYCWLNGPVARQLGFDCGQGEICEAKNAQLGRLAVASGMPCVYRTFLLTEGVVRDLAAQAQGLREQREAGVGVFRRRLRRRLRQRIQFSYLASVLHGKRVRVLLEEFQLLRAVDVQQNRHMQTCTLALQLRKRGRRIQHTAVKRVDVALHVRQETAHLHAKPILVHLLLDGANRRVAAK